MPLYAYAKRPCTMPDRIQSFTELDGVPGFQPGFLGNTTSFASYDDLLSIRESLSSSDEDSLSSGGASDIQDDDAFSLRKHITSEWEKKFQEGLFRYDVTACESKVIEGRLGFIAQLNEGRHSKKRPTEFRVDKVLQAFDATKFNFTKVGQNEMLFRFEEGKDEESRFYEAALVEESPSLMVINVSPIDYGHVLLVPRVLDKIPQRMDESSLLMALRLASEVNDPAFRIGYNSLGAFATINHLHFQAYFLDLPFAIERASSKEIAVSTNEVKVGELVDYPVKTLVFQAGACLEQMASAAAAACCKLQEGNIPFNLFIVDRGTRLFLIPQRYAERQARGEISQELLDTQVNPAVFEISGHIVCKRREDYDNASEEWTWKLLEATSLTEEGFEVVRKVSVEALAASAAEYAEIGMRGVVGKGKVEFVSETGAWVDFAAKKGVSVKSDHSPLTDADSKANALICSELARITPHVPIVSEETKLVPYAVRKEYQLWWCVDPLDGTKEFIKRNGQFTVNIALVKGDRPILGVVHTPCLKKTHWAVAGKGAFLRDHSSQSDSSSLPEDKPIRAAEYTDSDPGLTGPDEPPLPAKPTAQALPEKASDDPRSGLDFLRATGAPVTPEPPRSTVHDSAARVTPTPSDSPHPVAFTLPPAVASCSKDPPPPSPSPTTSTVRVSVGPPSASSTPKRARNGKWAQSTLVVGGRRIPPRDNDKLADPPPKEVEQPEEVDIPVRADTGSPALTKIQLREQVYFEASINYETKWSQQFS
ncbi:unnamed protein product [Closterium sp. NIES-54]